MANITINGLTAAQLAGIAHRSSLDNKTGKPALEWYADRLEWELNTWAAESGRAEYLVLADKIAALPEADREAVAALITAKEEAAADVPAEPSP